MMKITTLNYKKESFVIVKENDYYLAINTMYIDNNGCLTKRMNGFEMNADKSLDNCIKLTKQSVDIKELRNKGVELTPQLIADLVSNC